MELEVPKYDLKHTRSIVGYGNFSYTKQKENENSMVDISIVEQKFKLWNYIAEKELITKGTKLERLKTLSLLKDKTIMAYAYFKFDNKPFKLRWTQDCLLSDNHDRILYAAANQTGKSLTLDADAAIEFLRDHGKNWVGILVSSSLPQSQYQMDRIKLLLKSAKISYKEEETVDTKTGKKDNATQLSYTFYDPDGKTPLYTNFLICCPHTSSALGYPADDIWLDEFDFWENIDQKHFVYQIIIPRTFETGGKIKIFSNPNGKDRMLYELWNQKDEQGNYVWHRYNFNYWDKPGANQKEFDKLKTGMTRQQVDSTLLAVFSQSAGAFLSYEEIKNQLDSELCQKGDQAGYGRETAWFLDVGSVHDQSSLTGGYISENKEQPELPIINGFYIHKYPVGYPLARVVGILPKEKDGWEDEAEDNPSVKSVLEEYSEEEGEEKFLPLFGCDVTGNSGIIPLFNTVGIEPVDITFSGPKKWRMYQRYQAYSQQRYFCDALHQERSFCDIPLTKVFL